MAGIITYLPEVNLFGNCIAGAVLYWRKLFFGNCIGRAVLYIGGAKQTLRKFSLALAGCYSSNPS